MWNCFKKINQKTVEETRNLFGDKIAYKFTNNLSNNNSGTDSQKRKKQIDIAEKDIYHLKKDIKLIS